MIKSYRFIKEWEDLGFKFKKGFIIDLDAQRVLEVEDRIKKDGETCDLVTWGFHHIPFTFLEEVK